MGNYLYAIRPICLQGVYDSVLSLLGLHSIAANGIVPG